MHKNEKAQDDLVEDCIEMAKDGVSLVAIDESTDEVVGVLFNKIHVRGHTESYEHGLDACTKEYRTLMKMTQILFERADIFEKYNVDASFEAAHGAVLKSYQGKGVASRLFKESYILAEKLKNRELLVRLRPDLQLHLPKVWWAIFTGDYSAKIGLNLGCEIIHEEPYETFEVDGVKYTEGRFKSCVNMAKVL